MKRLSIIINILLICIICVAKERVVERIYISTDKNTYIAGSRVLCSIYNFDIENDSFQLSSLSSICYVMLVSEKGAIQTAKAVMRGGRGVCQIELPENIPTGNYALYSYTHFNLYEENFRPFVKTISVFNTTSIDRVGGGVEVKSNYVQKRESINEALMLELSSSSDKVCVGEEFKINIENLSDEMLNYNISVYYQDLLVESYHNDIIDFIKTYSGKSGSIRFKEGVVPKVEMEGEILTIKINANDSIRNLLIGNNILMYDMSKDNFLSVAAVDENGECKFALDNIYGEEELVFEFPIERINERCRIEIVSPFVLFDGISIPKLIIDPAMKNILRQKMINNAVEEIYYEEELYDQYPKYRKVNILGDIEPSVYNFDDFFRFPTMGEYMKDALKEFLFGKLIVEKYHKEIQFSNKPLIFINGIHVSSYDELVNYRPEKVATFSIYQYVYHVDRQLYDGAVDIRTVSGEAIDAPMNTNVQIIPFKGLTNSYRVRSDIITDKEQYPNYRDTIEWDALSVLEGDARQTIKILAPFYEGSLYVVVEGITTNGNVAKANLVVEVYKPFSK